MKKKYDIAIAGVGIGANYGSALTYFAISETIKSLGKSVVLIGKLYGAKVSDEDPELSDRNPSLVFAKEYNEVTKPYAYDDPEIEELNDIADTFVIGTDQVWGNNIANFTRDGFHLGFVSEDKRKVSIAASFGHWDDFTPLDMIDHRKSLYHRFNKISVREFDGVKILRDKYRVEASQVLEPVFYLDNERYFEVANGSTLDTSKPYILTYILDMTEEKQKALDAICDELGLKVRVLPDGFENVIRNIGDYKFTPKDVLKLFRDAAYVVTDSFHGTSFSLKFNKNFIALVNPKRGVSRFNTLLEVLGENERFVFDYSDVYNNPKNYIEHPDYTVINERILEASDTAKLWIKEALEVDVNQKVNSLVVDNRNLYEKLINNVWKFGRRDIDVTYTDKWIFSPNGKIEGYKNSNEAYWKIFNNRIIIYNNDYRGRAVFEDLIDSETEDDTIYGKSMLNSDNKAVFFLELNKETSLSDFELTVEARVKNVFPVEKVTVEEVGITTEFDRQEIYEYITNHQFVLYRDDEKNVLLSDEIELLSNESIYGMPQNSSSIIWNLENNKIIFNTFSGVKNILFDVLSLGSGNYKFSGYWKEKGILYILEEKHAYEQKINHPVDLKKPNFIFTTNKWEQVKIGEINKVLRIGPGAIGDQAIIPLGVSLQKEIVYNIELTWAAKTSSPFIYLHLKNSKTGKIQRIHMFNAVDFDISNSGIIPVSAAIVPDGDDYDQILFSSLEFIGDNTELIVDGIKIDVANLNKINTSSKNVGFDELEDVVKRDFKRFKKYNANWHKAQNKENVSNLIMFFSHAVEKGLSHAEFRPGFGINPLTQLANNLNIWYNFSMESNTFFNIGIATSKKYFLRHSEVGFDVEDRKKFFRPEILKKIEESTGELGGVDYISKENRMELNKSDLFVDVVNRRRSLREWEKKAVDLEQIRSAIQIALTSPSVCNRQGSRVHIVTDSQKIAEALRLQGGMVGYDLPPILLLVTNDISSFSFFTERNQPFIDGGIFEMALLLGLEYEQLAAVPLHAMLGTRQENEVRKVLEISDSEVFISFIAVGNMKSSLLTPHSSRLTVDDVTKII